MVGKLPTWTAFDGTAWSPVALLSHHQTNATPAMAVLDDVPYALHEGNGDNKLWCVHAKARRDG